MKAATPRPIIALVGRPNVGKSTLFNRIAGRRAAIVENLPGVTRDRNYADVTWEGRLLSLVDTGGFEPTTRDRLMTQVRDQARLAVEEASAVVLVVDGREGLTSVDEAVANLLRRGGKPYFIAANKMDTSRTEESSPLAEFHGLGLGDVFGLSAEHGRGVDDLLEAIIEKLEIPRAPPEPEEDPEAAELEADDGPPSEIRLAIVGRPNVGKSTFVNALLGKERFVVSEVPGTTRDAIDTELEHRGRRFVVTDTAGIRKKRADVAVEAASIIRAMKAMDRAEVVACLLDATEAGVEQDARLLGMVAEKAKCLLVVVNKWDIAEREGATKAWYKEELLKRLPFVAFAPMLFVSAKEGTGVVKVLDEAARLTQQYRARFPTHPLNELLEQLQDEHPAPIHRGKRVKLFYVAQVDHSPPTFSIQCNRPEALPDDYCRYVENRLRAAFGLEVPMRLLFKERKRDRQRKPPRKE